MKKISVLLLAVLSVVMISCDKTNEEETNRGNFRAGVSIPGGSKLGLDSLNFKWDESDKLYMFGGNPEADIKIATFDVDEINTNAQTQVAQISSNYEVNLPTEEKPYQISRDVFYLGDGTFSTIDDDLNELVTVDFAINTQIGSKESIGNYIILLSSEPVGFKNFDDSNSNEIEYFEYVTAYFTMISQVAVAYVDLSEFEKQGPVTITHENVVGEAYAFNTKYTLKGGYTDDEGEDLITNILVVNRDSSFEGLTITAPSDKTYIVMLPPRGEGAQTAGPKLKFTNNGKTGYINFPEDMYIRANTLYTGPDGNPIKLGDSKGEIVETQLF